VTLSAPAGRFGTRTLTSWERLHALAATCILGVLVAVLLRYNRPTNPLRLTHSMLNTTCNPRAIIDITITITTTTATTITMSQLS
jgi:hypothetical protein